MADHDTSPPVLPGLTRGARDRLVRAALNEDQAEPDPWDAHEILSGASGAQVLRVHGEARLHDRPARWSLVIKVFSLGGDSWQHSSTDPNAWDYWKREWLVYRAPWLDHLGGRLAAPRRLGSGELAGPILWVALEDVGDHDRRPWSPSTFHDVARELGLFNGSYLTGRPMPTDPWLSAGWLRGWTERAGPMMSVLPSVADHPLVKRLFWPEAVSELLRVWHRRRPFLAALDALPQTLCHLDFFPPNAFVEPAGGRVQAIDWAYCGRAPIGADIAPLVGGSLAYNEADHGEELESTCIDGYLAGLRDTGWSGSRDDAYFGYLASDVLRYAVGIVGPVVSMLLDERRHHVLQQMFDQSIDEFLDDRVGMMRFQISRMIEAQRLLASR